MSQAPPTVLKLVETFERMLDLHKRLAAAKTPDEKTRLEREIKYTDDEIDQLVYELYGLSDDEIRIVEEATVTAVTTKARRREGMSGESA